MEQNSDPEDMHSSSSSETARRLTAWCPRLILMIITVRSKGGGRVGPGKAGEGSRTCKSTARGKLEYRYFEEKGGNFY